MNVITLKFNRDCGPYSEGQIVKDAATEKGLPTDSFLRRRLKDAEIDNCVEIVKPKKSKSEKVKDANDD